MQHLNSLATASILSHDFVGEKLILSEKLSWNIMEIFLFFPLIF